MTLTANHPSQALVDLVGTLGGTWHGRTAMCLCPAHSDRTPSLSLRQGDRGILVTCFAGCSRTDVLRALSSVAIRGGHGYSEPAPPSRGGHVERLWSAAVAVRGTVAERYLALRGLLATDDLRFHPRTPYRPKPWTTFHPALIVPVHAGCDLTAVQRVFLDPQTGRSRAKLMLGRPGAGAWQGGGRWGQTLALAEGFETAAAYSLLHGVPCWASLGARRYPQVLLPLSITRLILAGDADAEGRRAVDLAARVYARSGLTIEEDYPPAHNDWADELAIRRGTSPG